MIFETNFFVFLFNVIVNLWICLIFKWQFVFLIDF